MTKTLTLTALLSLLLAIPAGAQTILTNTTLAAAASSSPVQTVTLTSATGVSAPAATDPTAHTYLYVDREAMDVRSIVGTKATVVRGAQGTRGAPHASGAVVFVIPASAATLFKRIPHGSCTRTSEQLLPRIHLVSGTISDCDGGQWLNSDALQTTRSVSTGLRLPDPMGTIISSLETDGIVPVAATDQYCTELDMPTSMMVTGLGVLNGLVVGTDLHNVSLYDWGGSLLANSLAAGALSAGASTYDKHNFLKPYYVVAPGKYIGCVQTNGTTDTFRHLITSVNNNVYAFKVTVTYGTLAAITNPSTFTTAQGPYWLVF